jgi:hypothetical protein
MVTPLDLIRQLDGMAIEGAQFVLREAISLLPRLQVVSKDSPLLIEALSTTDSTLRSSPPPATHNHRQT